MEDLLLESRRLFREEINLYIIKRNSLTERIHEFGDENPTLTDKFYKSKEINFEGIKKFAKNQMMTERLYRRAFLISKIEALGLKEYSEEIIDGMNKNFGEMRVTSEKEGISVDKAKNEILTESDACLIYGLNYIDDWEKYHDLWKDLDN